MSNLRQVAYEIDPALWVREVLGVTPTAWQETFLRAPRGASLPPGRQDHHGGVGDCACDGVRAGLAVGDRLPAQRQSAEAVRRVREILLKVDAKLTSDNVYALELDNCSRVLALPGSDDSIRGLMVDGWIVADEAARLSEDIIAALRPMRARRPQARLAMLSTAWSRTDPFWTAWMSDDPTWIRLKATVDMDPTLFPAEYLKQERKALGEHAFRREYLGIPVSSAASPFTWELYERVTDLRAPLMPPGPAFGPPPQPPPVPVPNPFRDPSFQGAVR